MLHVPPALWYDTKQSNYLSRSNAGRNLRDQRCRCFWPDDLSPVPDKIFAADAFIVGSPIYLGDTTSQLHAQKEKLRFSALSYDDYHIYFEGKVNVGVLEYRTEIAGAGKATALRHIRQLYFRMLKQKVPRPENADTGEEVHIGHIKLFEY